MADPVDVLLSAHGLRGPWKALNATGVANRIYATADFVIRVATDHPDAVPDARTESVAAPAARAAGVRTPRLIVFDDSRTLVDRPFSVWERIHGETLGLARFDARRRERVWCEAGREIRTLHERVRECPDPRGYLDVPGYEPDLHPTLAKLADSGAPATLVRDIERLVADLAPHVPAADAPRTFVHDDLHEMNVMCTPAGELLAVIDWGDAGWGDPVRDFVSVPFECMAAMFAGYGAENRTRLGTFPEARIVWAKLHDAMDDAIDLPGAAVPMDEFRRFLDRGA